MSITDSREDVARPAAGFRATWRGYDREQVDTYAARVEEELRLLTADRDAAADCAEELAKQLEELRNENDALRARLDRVCAEPIESDGLSVRLLHMVELAHEEATEITERAHATAEVTRTSAEKAAKRLRGRYEQLLEELDERSVQLEAEHQELIRRTEAEAERRARETEQRRRELDEQATRRRQEVEREFASTMAARREEATRAIAQRDAEAKEKAERLVREAHEHAERVVAEAVARVQALDKVRGRIADELRHARQVLSRMMSLTEPVPGEADLVRTPVPTPRTPEASVHPGG